MVVVIGIVQRLVNVADEMNEEFERLRALGRRFRAVGEKNPVPLDRVDDAFAVFRVGLAVDLRIVGAPF